MTVGIIPFVGLCLGFGDLGIVLERVEDTGKIDRCKYCGKFMQVGNIHKDAEVVLGNLLREALTGRATGYRTDGGKGTYINLLVYRFEERKGGNFAVDRPAGVGFHMHLMEDGALKRVFVFDEDQQALTDNLLGIGKFFRRGAKWVTVEDLSREGINQGLGDLLEDRK